MVGGGNRQSRGLLDRVFCFLDLKKAFDTVNHNLLLTELQCMGIRGQTLEWFKSYLSNRFQAVFINGVLSEHEEIRCGVPLGSILGPLLFLIYINDLSGIIDFATTRMYVDDTNLTELQEQMSVDIQCLKNWLIASKLTLDIIKPEFMLVGSRQRIADDSKYACVYINGIFLNRINCSKCLAVEIDEFLTSLLNIYQSVVEPYFDYCGIVWNGIGDNQVAKLQELQNQAARVITGADCLTPTKEISINLACFIF